MWKKITAWILTWSLLSTAWCGLVMAGHLALEAFLLYGPLGGDQIALTAMGARVRAVLACYQWSCFAGVTVLAVGAGLLLTLDLRGHVRGPQTFVCYALLLMLCLACWSMAAVLVGFMPRSVKAMSLD